MVIQAIVPTSKHGNLLETKTLASIKKDARSGQYHFRFRFDGRSYRRSLKTGNKVQAQATLARAVETTRLLKHGRIEVTPDEDIADYLISEEKQISLNVIVLNVYRCRSYFKNINPK